MNLKEDDLVLCTVKSVEGTTVFLELDSEEKGSMTLSEVAPGRIRNIREFIIPGKKIVCKVLRVYSDHVELSLRRVTGKERELVLEKDKKEKTLSLILKPVLKEKTMQILKKIEEKFDLSEFLDKVRANPEIIEPFVSKSESELLKKLFVEKKEKPKEIKRIIIVKSIDPSGINIIKQILQTDKASIHYLGSSKFQISVTNSNFKHANAKIDAILGEMKDKAKKLGALFEIK